MKSNYSLNLTYNLIYKYLLIEKDICGCRNISIKFPCVCVCLFFGDLFNFLVKVFPFLSLILRYSYFGTFLSTWSVYFFESYTLCISCYCCILKDGWTCVLELLCIKQGREEVAIVKSRSWSQMTSWCHANYVS
jgi:hypothetical protein